LGGNPNSLPANTVALRVSFSANSPNLSTNGS
jgi:hypothetical protein